MKYIITPFFKLYKLIISPLLGTNCRFHPTCSEYCKEALEVHGVFRGGMLSVWRILRCNPWGGQGIDNVPKR